MRFAITRDEEGGREVPVATSCRGKEEDVLVVMGRLKKRAGTEPHVKGPVKEATAGRLGWRKRSNLWTLFCGVPAWEKIGLMMKRRGPHCRMSSSFERMGDG